MKTVSALEIEMNVVAIVALRAMAFLLSCLNKVCHNKWPRRCTWACYLLVPVLVARTFGLMERSEQIKELPQLCYIWGFMLLVAFSSLDNLNCFRLNELSSKLNLLFQYAAKAILLFFCLKYVHFSLSGYSSRDAAVTGSLLLFGALLWKVDARLLSMGHACGETTWIRKWVRRIIDYMNEKMGDDDGVDVDPVNMNGVEYVVGVEFTMIESNRIEIGLTVEMIWGCRGELLRSGDPDGQLKDTCLSFALFWLILGRFWGYPLYEGRRSKANAWKLVYDGLVGQGSAHERVFRIIEVELSFLQDYFYSNYMVQYQCGILFYKISNFLQICVPPIWWYSMKKHDYWDPSVVDPIRNGVNTETVVLLVIALEVMQFILLIASKWARVSLLCHYVIYREMLSPWALKALAALSRGSSFLDNKLFKPWKRKLDQYSLLESCAPRGTLERCVGYFTSSFGIHLFEPGRKMGASVVLCKHVKRAVFESLCIDSNGPKLSDGVASLRRNGVEDAFSWSCKPKKLVETILLWHVATGLCEMNPNSQQDRSQEHFKVATTLSRYCAYLLFSVSSLLPVPAIQAEFMCDTIIEETKKVFRDDELGLSMYEKMKEHYRLSFDEEENWVEGTATLLQKGVKLGEELVSAVEDEGRRWKILAEFWAEMILYLAPSNSNQMAHADKLADGGEFITHLWALLIHAGVVDRENMFDSVEKSEREWRRRRRWRRSRGNYGFA